MLLTAEPIQLTEEDLRTNREERTLAYELHAAGIQQIPHDQVAHYKVKLVQDEILEHHREWDAMTDAPKKINFKTLALLMPVWLILAGLVSTFSHDYNLGDFLIFAGVGIVLIAIGVPLYYWTNRSTWLNNIHYVNLSRKMMFLHPPCWEARPLDLFSKKIPEKVREAGKEISARVPGAQLVEEYFFADPFAVAIKGDEKIYFGFWDEPGFSANNIP